MEGDDMNPEEHGRFPDRPRVADRPGARCALLLALVLAAAATARADGITPDELRDLAASQEHDSALHAGELNTSAPDTALPAARRAVAPPGGATQSTKYDAPAVSGARDHAATAYPGSSAGVAAPAGAILSDAVIVKNVYGIHLGTWMRGELTRNVSSAEPGLVELTLSRDVIGDRHVLPAGTTFFARQTLNDATRRMELFVEKGITPDGNEFPVQGIVYDLARVSGLAGIITVNKHRLVAHGAEKGLAAAVGGVANNLVSSSPLASAGATAAGTMLNDTDPAVNYTDTTSVIYVSPQRLEIRVDADF